MSRLEVRKKSKAQLVVDNLYEDLERRIIASPPGLCPVDMTASFLKLFHAQTCGKCVPCRIGLGVLEDMLEDVLDGKATLETLSLIERTAKAIYDSADCAIGYEAGRMVLKGLEGFREDFIEHITNGHCSCHLEQPVPCVALCPAGVDVPGYISLIADERYADAVKLIRKDNPFVTSCALVCEHPCETKCRRNFVDDAVNIRGLKRYAADHCGLVPPPECCEPTGKTVAIIGGGPSGLSAAYYLQQMGHQCTIFEQRKELGGMLYYGIPNYRLPKERLAEDIQNILATGVETKMNTCIGDGDGEISFKMLKENYDAVYISIGAHTDKKIGIEGEESEGATSAVEMLRAIGDQEPIDYTGQDVIVVGGGNVAMDCARSAVRCNAEEVSIIYRRRQKDMTALESEVESAVMEGIALVTLQAPVEITKDENGNCKSLITQPQMISAYRGSRPAPKDAAKEKQEFKADVIMIAVGQDIVSAPFEEFGIPAKWNILQAGLDTEVKEIPGVFTGGDCATGPSTVIRAIAAGKVAAHNIDEYLGYHHTLTCEAVVPEPKENMRDLMGRTEIGERPANIRKKDFEHVEELLTHEEAMQEACRCLRCDHFGCGAMVGGRDL
mgnify:CR=1 FL=1